MPVPLTIADLDATASNNSPSGSEAIGTSLDDYLRAHAAILKQVSNADLKIANNLSDLASASTARTNLGLTIAATATIGTAAGNLVQLDGSAKLPAVDGSQLTNIPTVIPDGSVTPAKLSQKITAMATQTAANNTTFDFTSIPSWAKVIHIGIAGISTNGATSPQIQLGTSGGFETSSYLGSVDVGGTAANFSSGFTIGRGWSSSVVAHGGFTLMLADAATNTWTIFGNIGGSHAAVVSGVGGGSKALAGVLDRLRLYIDGTQQFDAGKIAVTYE